MIDFFNLLYYNTFIKYILYSETGGNYYEIENNFCFKHIFVYNIIFSFRKYNGRAWPLRSVTWVFLPFIPILNRTPASPA